MSIRVFGFRLHPVHWLIIIGVAVVVPVAMMIVITKVLVSPPASWWWTFGVLIVQGFIAFVVGLIILIIKLNRAGVPVGVGISPVTFVEKTVHALKYDEDNPDNFMIRDKTILNVGEPGSARTPVIWLRGLGSENLDVIDVIGNLSLSEFRPSIKRNANIREVVECIKFTAEHPESVIEEQTQTGTDFTGRPVFSITKKFVTQSEKEREKAKQEAEEHNVM